jgi:hypothetical protein
VPRRDKESTRQLLLETGYAIMLERGIEAGWGVRVSDVTDRVGLTTGAAYQIWNGSRTVHGTGGQDRFHHDLALYALDRLISDVSVSNIGVAADLANEGASLDRIVKVLGERDFAMISAPAEFACFLALLSSTTSDAELGEATRDAYQGSTAVLVDAYTEILDHFGLEMVPPYTLDQLVVSAIALADGLCMRQLVDPEAIDAEMPAPDGAAPDADGPWHLVAIGTRALVTAMTRPREG